MILFFCTYFDHEFFTEHTFSFPLWFCRVWYLPSQSETQRSLLALGVCRRRYWATLASHSLHQWHINAVFRQFPSSCQIDTLSSVIPKGIWWKSTVWQTMMLLPNYCFFLQTIRSRTNFGDSSLRPQQSPRLRCRLTGTTGCSTVRQCPFFRIMSDML